LGYFYEYPVTVVSPRVETKPNALPEMFIFGRTALQSCHILARINGRWKIWANKTKEILETHVVVIPAFSIQG
jgi:hypothetical protein